MSTPFIKRVTLHNFKSIAYADVKLPALTFLVGPNGGGKSNFVDAFHFVADALSRTLDHAIRARGGINDVRRRSAGRPNHPKLHFYFALPDDIKGYYSFEIGAAPKEGFRVQTEECFVTGPEIPDQGAFYKIEGGEIQDTTEKLPPPSPDRLHLVAASSLPEFRPVFEHLSRMAFYNLNPRVIRDMQPAASSDLLFPDGSNLASVVNHLPSKARTSILEYLSHIVPEIQTIDTDSIAGKEALVFRQSGSDGKHPWKFYANSMSDGTLRALAVLVALFQESEETSKPYPLIGIEEPEIALHPAGAGILLDALMEASHRRQILVTSHSPDLLDNDKIPTKSLLAVDFAEGKSVIAPLDDASRSSLKDRLFTPGEMLRLNQLAPGSGDGEEVLDEQQTLFDES